ncbi:MAG: GNAT family N-acetyltransferase [Moraxellaceae bacterium]|nr:MAG: GNAT family N-acetyltransferase [Moraxellaceae bacterium]
MEIVVNKKELLQYFIQLNEEWISTYFELEEADFALAKHPNQIIENGGYVFSMLIGGSVVGVCALFNEGNGIYQLARMAVSPKFHRQGFGAMLIEACLSKLKEVKADRVYLISNTRLTSAIALYKKYNFVTTYEGVHPIYSRANICMERKIL